MTCPKCRPQVKPRNLATSLVDLYVSRLSPQELAEVSHRSMQLMKERSGHGLNDAAECWAEGFLSLLLQKGWLRSLDQLEADLQKSQD